MPPSAVKTIRDLIYYQYAKVIAGSAGAGKYNYAFIMDRFEKLRTGEIKMSDMLREIKKQFKESEKGCEFCGATKDLSFDHIIPHSRGGPDSAEKLVLACKSCNSSKGKKGLYEWYGVARKDELPRIVVGKYLKLLHEIHERNGTLDKGDMKEDGKLDVLDLEVY